MSIFEKNRKIVAVGNYDEIIILNASKKVPKKVIFRMNMHDYETPVFFPYFIFRDKQFLVSIDNNIYIYSMMPMDPDYDEEEEEKIKEENKANHGLNDDDDDEETIVRSTSSKELQNKLTNTKLNYHKYHNFCHYKIYKNN